MDGAWLGFERQTPSCDATHAPSMNTVSFGRLCVFPKGSGEVKRRSIFTGQPALTGHVGKAWRLTKQKINGTFTWAQC